MKQERQEIHIPIRYILLTRWIKMMKKVLNNMDSEYGDNCFDVMDKIVHFKVSKSIFQLSINYQTEAIYPNSCSFRNP